MQVRTKIALCVSTLAIVIVACAGLLLWNTDRATYNHKRTSLAYEELAGYLRLSGEVFRTFKQVRRDLIDGSGELAVDIDEAEVRIFAILDEISKHVSEESRVGWRPDEAVDDLPRIALLRDALADVFRDVRTSQRLVAAGRGDQASALLGRSLEEQIDGQANTIIEAALADERGELAQALREIEDVNRIAIGAALFATLSGIALTALVIFILVIRLRDSLANLQAGAEVFASGRLDHAIPVSGDDEFATLARRFNVMASQLRQKHRAVEDARTLLEIRVGERTEELRAVNDELKRRDANRRQFFADIGHELRTPITAIRGEAEVALRSRQDREESYRDALDRIVGITDDLTRFVNDIFLIAREQAGVLDMRKEVIDLTEAVGTAIDQLRTTGEPKGIEIGKQFECDEMLIDGDLHRIGQLVRILVTNAIQHSPPGTSVAVTLRAAGTGWELGVLDNGPGISVEDEHRVFERFYRGQRSSENTASGNAGLGLPIAKSLVQAHGGRIWIDQSHVPGTAVRAWFNGHADDLT